MRKIGISIIGVVVLGGATVLAANIFPDQSYALLQHMRRWVGMPASGVSQGRPAPHGTSSPAKSVVMRFVLLPETVLGLCSRPVPKVNGSWKATEQQIATLESNLKRISSLRSAAGSDAGLGLKGISIAHPEDCYRQYIPVIVAGRKLIYVNAFCGTEMPGWRTGFVSVCDGGESFWGVLYDPTTGEFSDLEVNGIA